MKGLLKYLSPFAPDQSGACSVLFDMGGILVICDAGGCTGNICGFDEPRWFGKKSAIFSAGLRDMDAILGRDDKLVAKLKLACDQVGGSFAAVIGTPVPAVIATDYRALKRLAKKQCDLPVLGIECKGCALYDEGARDAWMELFQTFVNPELYEKTEAVGILGMTPLDISMTDPSVFLTGDVDYVPFGMGAGLSAVEKAATVSSNLVVSPAALKVARFMEKTYGIPFVTGYPFFTAELKEAFQSLSGKKVLVIHQQMAANEIRNLIGKMDDENIVCGTWFMQDKEFKAPQDVHFDTEQGFCQYVLENQFDVIIGDGLLRRAIKEFEGDYMEIPHYAISGYDGE